jgi:hypothetical protein
MFNRVEATNTILYGPKVSAMAVRQIKQKHYKMLSFTFEEPWPEKTKEHRLGSYQPPLEM